MHEGDSLFGERVLAFIELRKCFLRLLIAPDFRVTKMFARHQHTPRRRTDRCTAVMLGEPHPLCGEPVDVRRRDLLLAIAAEFTPAEIIRKYEYDILYTAFLGRNGLC